MRWLLAALFIAVSPAPSFAQIGEEILPPVFVDTLLEAGHSTKDVRVFDTQHPPSLARNVRNYPASLEPALKTRVSE